MSLQFAPRVTYLEMYSRANVFVDLYVSKLSRTLYKAPAESKWLARVCSHRDIRCWCLMTVYSCWLWGHTCTDVLGWIWAVGCHEKWSLNWWHCRVWKCKWGSVHLIILCGYVTCMLNVNYFAILCFCYEHVLIRDLSIIIVCYLQMCLGDVTDVFLWDTVAWFACKGCMHVILLVKDGWMWLVCKALLYLHCSKESMLMTHF